MSQPENTLIDRNGFKADTFSRGLLSEDARLVPFADLAGALETTGNQPLGVEIANTVRVDELLPVLERLSLIAIAFPGFGDGRGFSIAKSLRNAGYRGTLRAVGPLIADQFAYALACGFDEIELPEASAKRQPIAIWLAAARAFRATYQRNHQPEAGLSVLDQRKAARARAAE